MHGICAALRALPGRFLLPTPAAYIWAAALCYVEWMPRKDVSAHQLEWDWDTAPPSAPAPASAPAAEEHAPGRETLEAHLRTRLEQASGRHIVLTLTNNRRSMMHMRVQAGGTVALRLHQMFLEGGDDVIAAVAAWITKPRDRSLWPVLDAFISQAPTAPPSERRVRIAPVGKVYDLQQLFDELNLHYFENSITSPITWATHSARGRRTVCLGSYSPVTQIIRIHPNLDDAKVPVYVVKFVIYHEMLHAHLGIGTHASGRRAVHPRKFREMERAYPDFARAEAWINEPRNLRRVMRHRGLPR
jgi:hypothetical protein